MYGGFGRGRGVEMGAKGGLGFGLRGSSPPWPYVGIGRGGLPRCSYFKRTPTASSPAGGVAPITREEELNFLKSQVQALQDSLARINSRVHDLESAK